ncbi:salivary glue protein Sgs-3-like, partial [Vanessa cardui]|uniref:salivary glue protein Sgs-3-like n=1 Tax=Vanessa cardui TaxID=171605 RepID=UPI001F129D70
LIILYKQYLFYFLVCSAIVAVLFVAVAIANGEINQCPPEQEEDWTIEQLLRHEDCNKFYKCTFGKPVVMECPADLYFNLETWQCDWQANVDCTGRNVPDETTTSRPITSTQAPSTTTSTTTTTPRPTTTSTTTTTTTTPKPTTTSTTTTTTTTPKPTTTSTTTTTTTTPKPTTTSTTTTTTTTPKPTTTSTTTTTTTTPKPTTTTTTTTTPRPTTTTTTTTTPRPTTTTTTTVRPSTTTNSPNPDLNANGCPVNPHIHWLLPHEENCNQFYYCVWGEKVLRSCPSSLHFNRRIQVCDWPHDAGCAVSFSKHLVNRRALIASL